MIRYRICLLLVSLQIITFVGCSARGLITDSHKKQTPFAPVETTTIERTKTSENQVQHTVTAALPTGERKHQQDENSLPPDNALTYKPYLWLENMTEFPQGALVLDRPPSLLLFDQDLKKKDLSESACLSTSPNGKWLAYCSITENLPSKMSLVIESYDGIQKNEIPLEQAVIYFDYYLWLDQQRMIFPLQQGSDGLRPMLVVNTQTGEQEEMPSSYPGLRPSAWGPAGTLQFNYSNVVYDQSLNYVVYPEEEQRRYIVLWDRQSEKVLAKLEDLGTFSHYPVWAPNGDQFIIAVVSWYGDQPGEYIEELFSVRNDGNVTLLTSFSEYFRHAYIGAMNWSPDGRKLAFWIDTEPSQCSGQHLAILNMGNKTVLDTCVPGSFRHDASPPIWTLDNRYIAVENYYDVNLRRVLLLDTLMGWVAQVSVNGKPVGWLEKP